MRSPPRVGRLPKGNENGAGVLDKCEENTESREQTSGVVLEKRDFQHRFRKGSRFWNHIEQPTRTFEGPPSSCGVEKNKFWCTVYIFFMHAGHSRIFMAASPRARARMLIRNFSPPTPHSTIYPSH